MRNTTTKIFQCCTSMESDGTCRDCGRASAPTRYGAFRIVPNVANEQAETIEAPSVDDAIADFERRRPGVEVWDVIELRRAR
jgi:hypothetical protein